MGERTSEDKDYVRWLKQESMLANASAIAGQFSGVGEVPPGKDSVNLDGEVEERLQRAGHIVGRLQRVIFQDPGIKDTNWSATAPVTGPDGVERRWVYLDYFKDGQPSINWLDPTFAGMRLVIGDALHALDDLGKMTPEYCSPDARPRPARPAARTALSRV